LNIFPEFLSLNQIQEVSSKELEMFFHHGKKELGYRYYMMKLYTHVSSRTLKDVKGPVEILNLQLNKRIRRGIFSDFRYGVSSLTAMCLRER